MKLKIMLAFLIILFLFGCSQPEVVEPTTPAATPDDTTPTEPQTTTTPTATTNTTTTTAAGTTHIVMVEKAKFDPDKITIKAGDTITWKNNREEGRFGSAFIVGSVGVCRGLKSETFGPGEEFSYTFEEAGFCTYIDGIVTTAVGKITIE